MIRIICMLLLWWVFLPDIVWSAPGINRQIFFQGKLVNKGELEGMNVNDGSFPMRFTLWDSLSGGTSLWTEVWNSGTTEVFVDSGIFGVSLGTYSTFPPSVNFDTDNIYLSVGVSSDTDMSPRMRFSAVPYAFNAEKVSGLTISSGKNVLFGDNFSTTSVGITLDQSLATTDMVSFGGLSIGGSGSVLGNLSVGGSIAMSGVPLGTGTTVLFIDSAGNLVQGTLPSGGAASATNGLSLILSSVGLGGSLTQNTQIGMSDFGLSFVGLGGTRTMYIDPNGNVGVGTTNPTVRFDIRQLANDSGLRIYGYNDQSTKYLQLGINPYGQAVFSSSSDSTRFWFGAPVGTLTGSSFVFGDNANYGMRYGGPTNVWGLWGDGSNNSGEGNTATIAVYQGLVGIGMSTPTRRLDVSGDIKLTGSLFVGLGVTGSDGQVLASDGDGGLEWITAGGATYYANNGLIMTGTTIGLGGSLTQNTQIGISNFNYNMIGIGGSSVLGITSAGYVGIGTTNPEYKLHVMGDGLFGAKLGIGATGTNSFNVSADAGVGTNLSVGGSLSLTGIPIGTGSTVLFIAGDGKIVQGTLPVTGSGQNDKTWVLSPEYSGAVLTADGSGTTSVSITSDNSLNSGGIGWKNYYELTSTQSTLQDYTVAVRITLPSDFLTWQTGSCPGSSCALEFGYQTGLVGADDNYISIIVSNDSDTPATAVCTVGSTTSVSWSSSGCTESVLNDGSASEWDAPGETAIIRFKLAAKNTASALARAGDIILRYKSSF